MPFHNSETVALRDNGPRSYHQAIHERAPSDIVGATERPSGKRIVPVPTGNKQRAGLRGEGKRINNSAHAAAVHARYESEKAFLSRRSGEPVDRPRMDCTTTATDSYNAGGFKLEVQADGLGLVGSYTNAKPNASSHAQAASRRGGGMSPRYRAPDHQPWVTSNNIS